MNDNKESRYWFKKLVFELSVLFIAAIAGTIFLFIKEILFPDDPDFYKLLLAFFNLIVVLIFFRFSDREFELEFAKDNSRDERKRKDKSKRRYWKLLNVEVKEGEVEVDGEWENSLKQAGNNEDRVNRLVEQLHQHIHLYAIFLIWVYFLFLIDNETLFTKLGWQDAYNLTHPYLKIGEDLANLLSALFIFLGFKVLYDKTLSKKNKKIKYQRGSWIFVSVVIIAYFIFIVISQYPIKSYRDASVSNVDKLIKTIEDPDKSEQDKDKEFEKLKKLSFSYYDNINLADEKSRNAFRNLQNIINKLNSPENNPDYMKLREDGVEALKNNILAYTNSPRNKNIEIISNLFLLLIGGYNGLTMALLFGRYISMEERVRAINKIKYKSIFTKFTIYILPIYALSQPLFGSFDINVFGNAKWFANGVFLFCLIGKIFFLYSTYWFMKERLMHYYLHLVLTSHGVPKDFYTCFDYKYKNLIDGQTETINLPEEKNLKNKHKSLEVKADSSIVELPTNQSVTDEEVLSLWADRPESAQELARKIRKGNRGTDD